MSCDGAFISRLPSKLTKTVAPAPLFWFKSIIPPLPIISPLTICEIVLDPTAPKTNLFVLTIIFPPISTLAATFVNIALKEFEPLLIVKSFSHNLWVPIKPTKTKAFPTGVPLKIIFPK